VQAAEELAFCVCICHRFVIFIFELCPFPRSEIEVSGGQGPVEGVVAGEAWRGGVDEEFEFSGIAGHNCCALST